MYFRWIKMIVLWNWNLYTCFILVLLLNELSSNGTRPQHPLLPKGVQGFVFLWFIVSGFQGRWQYYNKVWPAQPYQSVKPSAHVSTLSLERYIDHTSTYFEHICFVYVLIWSSWRESRIQQLGKSFIFSFYCTCNLANGFRMWPDF